MAPPRTWAAALPRLARCVDKPQIKQQSSNKQEFSETHETLLPFLGNETGNRKERHPSRPPSTPRVASSGHVLHFKYPNKKRNNRTELLSRN